MLTVLVTGPTVTQDSPFSSLAAAITVASTHFVYPRRDDQAELPWVAWLNTKTVYPANGVYAVHCGSQGTRMGYK